ncbi:MAG TPA: alpha-L-glutamate ligase-like protein [Syntrophorhabdaceae bacterium]|jgi:alpha-L-glutamate ligase-like protein
MNGPGAIKWLRQMGILGMNSRNAEYIMAQNARSSFPMVDDKIITKRLAAEFSIPTPQLYLVIENHGEINNFEQALGDHRSFALKPARGSGGSGIVLITDRNGEGFIKQSGAVISKDDFLYHIFDILAGIYSLEGLEDKAIMEALVHPDPLFAAVTYEGVPDIRIIAYRGVPAMAMVRLPTQASDGKANIHRGALGAGIDMARGETLSAVHGSEVVTVHPDTGNPIAGIRIPGWKEMLLTAAKGSDMTGLGYLGVDLVIDISEGPLMLEMNARPGLQIQVANGTGLKSRLNLIDRAPSEIFSSPESRVEWAMKTFGNNRD